MTLGEVIAYTDAIKPNAFSNEEKTRWMNRVEGMVQTEIFLFNPVDVVQYDYEADKDRQLLVNPPHDKLYEPYLAASIDFANGEYDKYQNSMQMFNAFYGEFMRWYADNYQPADAWKEGLL